MTSAGAARYVPSSAWPTLWRRWPTLGDEGDLFHTHEPGQDSSILTASRSVAHQKPRRQNLQRLSMQRHRNGSAGSTGLLTGIPRRSALLTRRAPRCTSIRSVAHTPSPSLGVLTEPLTRPHVSNEVWMDVMLTVGDSSDTTACSTSVVPAHLLLRMIPLPNRCYTPYPYSDCQWPWPRCKRHCYCCSFLLGLPPTRAPDNPQVADPVWGQPGPGHLGGRPTAAHLDTAWSVDSMK